MRSWLIGVVAAVVFAFAPWADHKSWAAEAGVISGKVVETMDAGTYTYIRVDTGKAKVWAAAPRFEVKVGEQVSFEEGLEMKDYQSKTLQRTFDSVYFVGAVSKGNAPAATRNAVPAAHSAATSDPHAGLKANSAALVPDLADFSGIKKAEGGLTVAEIFSQKDKLANQKVTLRGKVVKYNAQIMGKNWAHLRDGTGAAGANDVLVTTSDATRLGDTVLVKGTLVLNKDFGYGYKYDLLVEEAKVTVESKSKQ